MAPRSPLRRKAKREVLSPFHNPASSSTVAFSTSSAAPSTIASSAAPPTSSRSSSWNSAGFAPAASTIRVVDDADAKIYASSPFPVRESQRFPPRGRMLFHPQRGVSSNYDQPPATNLYPPPLSIIKTPVRRGSARYGSQSVYSTPDYPPKPSPLDEADRYSRASIDVDRLDMDASLIPNERRESDEIIQLPSVTMSRYTQAMLSPPPATPTRTPARLSGLGAIASRASQIDALSSAAASPMSVSSVGSSGTVVRRRGLSGPPPPGSYQIYRPSQSSERSHRRSNSTPPRPSNINTKRVSLSPVSSNSPSSPHSPSPVSPMSPDHQTRRMQVGSLNVEPSRPASEVESSSAGQAATSCFTIPRRPVRNSAKQSSMLSTIHSETTTDRSSMVEEVSNTSSMNVAAPQLPQELHVREREMSNSTIRVVSMQDKELPPLPPPRTSTASPDSRSPEPSAASGTPQGWVDPRGSYGSAEQSSPETSLWDSIPAWARYSSNFVGNIFLSSSSSLSLLPIGRRQPKLNVSSAQSANNESNTNLNTRAYYAQEAQNVIQRPDSLTLPGTPAFNQSQQETEIRPWDSNRYTVMRPMAVVPTITVDAANETTEARSDPRVAAGRDWSPHLWKDRRSPAQRRTIYKAPSIDEEAEPKSFNRRNMQILLFVLGFIFPPAWIIASFLALPPNPGFVAPGGAFERDLEKTLGPMDLARYENARWWRRLNRIMAVVGIGVIIAVIVLAVVGARNSR